MGWQGQIAKCVGRCAAHQGRAAVDWPCFGIEHTAQPGLVGIDGAVMAGKHRLAAKPDAFDRAEGQAQGQTIAKADDFAGKAGSDLGFNRDASADPQFAHRTHDFDQEALHGLDPAEDFDLVDCLNVGDQGLHRGPLHWI